MWKQLVLITAAISLLVLPAAAAAQDGTFRVWQALSSDETDAINALATDFAQQQGLEPSLSYIDGPVLLNSMLQAVEAGAAPDVIFASNSAAAPLREADLLAASAADREFFLEALMKTYPDLIGAACDDDAIAACLWPDAAAALPLVEPQSRALSVATSTLCEASPWLPFCKGSTFAMTPLSWDFDLYLINAEWLAENGLDDPVSADEVLDLRGEYAIRFTAARPGNIPTVDEANNPSVFVLSSRLLSEDPDAVIESLTTYYDAAYVPVVSLNIYGAYISTDAAHPQAAREFITGLYDSIDDKVALAADTGRLPALTPEELATFDASDPIVTYTLQSLALLTTFAALAY